MSKEMKRIDALTETGLVKVAVRNGLKPAVESKYFNEELGWIEANDGSYLMPLVEDLSGATVYARVQVTITAKDEFSTGRKKAKKENNDIDFSELV